jgi:sodium/proline symporter
MDIEIIIALLIYLTSLLCVGLYFCYFQKTERAFAVGGQSVNYLVTAIGAQSSDMSGWIMLGFPAAVFLGGLFELWTAIGLVVFMFLNWQFIAPRLRMKTAQLHSYTLSSLFDNAFDDHKGHLRVVSAILAIIFFICYIASGIVGLGRVFESMFAIDYHLGITIGLGIVLVYTILGGFLAVAWSNFFQGLFLLAMIIIVPLYAFYILPHGWSDILEGLNKSCLSHAFIPSWPSLGLALMQSVSWGIGYFGQPHILVYFMGIDDPQKIPYAKYVGLVWQAIALLAAAMVGFVALGFFDPRTVEPELIFVLLAQKIFHPVMVGFILCALLAAILSSVNSYILVAGSGLATDVYAYLQGKKHSSVRMMRIGTALVSCGALAIAWHNNSSVYSLVQFAWSGLGAMFGPLVIAALYSWPISAQGALAGAVTGAAAVFILSFFHYNIPALIVGFFANLFVAFYVSLFIFKKKVR